LGNIRPAYKCHTERTTRHLGSAMPSIDQIIVWVVVGVLGGSLAGFVITWDRAGFGLIRNLGLGLAGALVGGLIFRLFGLFPRLEGISVSLRDIVAAFCGSLVFLAAIWIWQNFSQR
jgi:uncharacterized membrane protein YeaQ/YmgE (transglycosylase-associated protein family)